MSKTTHPERTYCIAFDTEHTPGYLLAVKMTIGHDLLPDDDTEHAINLTDHALYADLQRYVHGNPRWHDRELSAKLTQEQERLAVELWALDQQRKRLRALIDGDDMAKRAPKVQVLMRRRAKVMAELASAMREQLAEWGINTRGGE